MFALAATIIFLLRAFGAIDNTDNVSWDHLAGALGFFEVFLISLNRSWPWPWPRRQG